MSVMGRCSVTMLTEVITLYIHIYIFFKLQDYAWFILMISGGLEENPPETLTLKQTFKLYCAPLSI